MIGRDRCEKARSGASGCPEQVGMPGRACRDDLTRRGDHLYRYDIGAGRAPFARVPAKAAGKNITAQPDIDAMADGKGETLLREPLTERGTDRPHTHARRAGRLVDLDEGDSAEIEQQA